MSDDDNVITLADGTRINPRTGRPMRDNNTPQGYVAVPTNIEAVNEVVKVRKRISDLPDIPEKMNVIGIVAAYYMFGLDDYEIAHALGLTEKQVGNIKMLDAFNQLIVGMTQSIIDTQQEDVRGIISRGANNAAQRLIEALSSESGQERIVAAKDILDRAGHRPVDVVEHRHKVEGGLTIEYVRKGDKDDNIPVLTLNAEDVTEEG